MTGLFWKRGFYFNNSLFIFNKFTSYLTLQKLLYGLSFFFSKLFFFRIELQQSLYMLESWRDVDYYIFNYYITITFPVFLEVVNQLKLNLMFFYLTKTNKGVSYFLSKPLYNKTRSRTYSFGSKKKKNFINFLK